ncbi:unnamed protein product [Merluccius merluccius]
MISFLSPRHVTNIGSVFAGLQPLKFHGPHLALALRNHPTPPRRGLPASCCRCPGGSTTEMGSDTAEAPGRQCSDCTEEDRRGRRAHQVTQADTARPRRRGANRPPHREQRPETRDY